ncbi:hypothetical protein [Agromyces albus]|uniref:hypothetical protein n=1 Tax=Agromyces albus TaxID=205332 RepID=UPI0027832BAE|nr:hypothetical protein [Agromyces albus]MDQ0577127.1 energy-coupling factor transporter ATP-binding protein EcfA2 [Agromyces albus]
MDSQSRGVLSSACAVPPSGPPIEAERGVGAGRLRGMPTAFDVRALESRVRIELDDSLSAADQESIKAHWVDLTHDGAGEPDLVVRAGLGDHSDSSHGSYSVRADSAEALAQRISSDVTIGAIGGLRGEALMLHASAVALDDGRVIGFVGPSGRGKTTASQTLGRIYGYVTDETLAVRADGSVITYPKPLSIGSWPGVKVTEPASTLGLRAAPADGLRLAAIVLLDRRPDIEQPFVESVPIIEALSELIPQTSYLSALERPLRTLLEAILSTGGVRRVVYSEAASLPPLIDGVLREIDDDAPVLTDVARMSERECDCFSGAAERRSDPSLAERPGAFWRATYIDALIVDDSLIVLVSGSAVVLAGVGPTLWLAADGLTEAEFQEIALRELPDPPSGIDAAVVISDAVQSMVEKRILVRT